MKSIFGKSVLSAMLLGTTVSAMAAEDEEKSVSLDFGADVVSSYIWRGLDCAGFSAQPYATVSFNKAGISFGVWASAELFSKSTFANMSEFDLVLSYAPTDKLSFTLTDYTFCNKNYWQYWTFNAESAHNLEATVAYDFGPVAFAWNTNLTGPDHWDSGKRAYSTYVEVKAPFTIGGVDCSATVGACPWGYRFGGIEESGFMVTNIAFGAEKEFFKVPVFANVIFNPKTEKTFFVAGIKF